MKSNLRQVALTLVCFQIGAHAQTVPVPDEGPAVFVWRIVSVGAAQRDAFVACLAKSDLPFWRGLQKQGLLAKVSVFETTSVTSSEPGVPAWNFVISSEVAAADSFLQAVEKRKDCDSGPGIELRRVETLKTTPNTHYARATREGDRVAREKKVEFSIEYIAVDPAKLDQWNQVFITVGPRRGLEIQGGWYFGGDALLTVKVNYSQAGMPVWNTIHVLARYPGIDAAASRAASDAATRQINPESGSYDALITPLRPFRTIPQMGGVRQLFELAVR
jgi:hypothetical protein